LSNDRPKAYSAAFPTLYNKGAFEMDENVKAIQNMLFERWSNGACLGYVIRAMENLDFDKHEIGLVVTELKELM